MTYKRLCYYLIACIFILMVFGLVGGARFNTIADIATDQEAQILQQQSIINQLKDMLSKKVEITIEQIPNIIY